jgi:hypothetical protein
MGRMVLSGCVRLGGVSGCLVSSGDELPALQGVLWSSQKSLQIREIVLCHSFNSFLGRLSTAHAFKVFASSISMQKKALNRRITMPQISSEKTRDEFARIPYLMTESVYSIS